MPDIGRRCGEANRKFDKADMLEAEARREGYSPWSMSLRQQADGLRTYAAISLKAHDKGACSCFVRAAVQTQSKKI